MRTEIAARLEQNGWQGRSEVVVIDPELEVWLWQHSPHVESALAFPAGSLRAHLQQTGAWPAGPPKPTAPKEAIQAKCSLDLFWIRDESLEDSKTLPDPHILAQEIADDLQSALDEIQNILGDLEARAARDVTLSFGHSTSLAAVVAIDVVAITADEVGASSGESGMLAPEPTLPEVDA